MQERINQILAQTGTKTSKIRQLITLGVSRTEIARLLTNGNYGQVQNVYTRMRAEGLLGHVTASITTPSTPNNETMTPRVFDAEFGVEFEAYNVSKTTLNNKLNAAGITCEVAGYTHRTTRYWKIVTDSSLSGRSTFELVSPILRGEAGLNEMMQVCKIMKQCGAKVNASCGTHVHINARNFSIDQWKRIFINYARLENVIDGFMPNSRRANHSEYCQGFSSVANFESRINNALTLNGIASGILSGRYWKVNPQSYSRHNTVEFRQHAGTTDYVKIATWIRFLSNLVDYSENHTVNERTLDSLRAFNSVEIVDYLKYRTLELTA